MNTRVAPRDDGYVVMGMKEVLMVMFENGSMAMIDMI